MESTIIKDRPTAVEVEAPCRLSFHSVVPRFTMWWRYIVPPMYGFIYLSINTSEQSLGTAVFRIILFTLTIIGTAGFGYFLNDWSDIEQDAKARKQNKVGGLSIRQRFAIALFLLIGSWGPWLMLPRNEVNMTFMVLQYVALFFYSCPPIRLKERNQWGLICDMLYGHLIPILVTIATFSDENSYLQSSLFFSLLVPWLICKGLRNILLHQVDDRVRDRSAGVITLVRSLGPIRIIKTINTLILPLEILTFTGLLGFLAYHGAYLFVGFIAFILFECLKVRIWRVTSVPIQRRWYSSLYLINNFYDQWLPLSALFVLVGSRPETIVLLVANVCMFPWPVFQFRMDFVFVCRNMFKH